jgi:uncharacterized protein (TIGR02001 family)
VSSAQRLARTLCLAACALAPPHARCQLAFSASAVSDYRFRGASLSDGDPVPQLGLAYDAPSGVFLGAFVSAARLRNTRANAQAVLYAGLARRIGPALSWEAGVSDARFQRAGNYNYHEVFAGLSGERVNARLYYSPRYFGVGGRSVYAELGATYPLGGRIDFVGHAGYLHPFEREQRGLYPQYTQAARADLRLGVSGTYEAWSAQLAWVATRQNTALYAGGATEAARALVLSTTRSF